MKKRILGVLGAVVMVVTGSLVFADNAVYASTNRECTSNGGHIQTYQGSKICVIPPSGAAKSDENEKKCKDAGGSYFPQAGVTNGAYICQLTSWTEEPCSGHTPGTQSYQTCVNNNQSFYGNNGGSTSGGGTSGGGTSSGGGGTNSGSNVTREDETEMQLDNECTDGVKTNFFGCVGGEDGEGIFRILAVVINVLTFGIGIAATIGFVISGLQYIMARDNAAQIEKAKMRMFQIVIGLVVYAMIWAVLQWLIPGGAFAS